MLFGREREQNINNLFKPDLPSSAVLIRDLGRKSGLKLLHLLAVGRAENVFKGLAAHITSDSSDRLRQRDILGTDLHTVLRVSAVTDASFLHQRAQARGLIELTRGMVVEEAHLCKNLRPHKLFLLAGLWTGLHTASTCHTCRQRIHDLLLLLADLRTRALVPAAVSIDPSVNFF